MQNLALLLSVYNY